MARPGGKAKVRMVCGACGSSRVIRDAWAEWREDAQEWALGMVFDHAFCHACERKTRIVEQAIEE